MGGKIQNISEYPYCEQTRLLLNIYRTMQNLPAPHEESNLDLAFRNKWNIVNCKHVRGFLPNGKANPYQSAILTGKDFV